MQLNIGLTVENRENPFLGWKSRIGTKSLYRTGIRKISLLNGHKGKVRQFCNRPVWPRG
jgi:creatinine amidohydrolase/Fe(II)-dependent formamide hydrolase-like protein